MTETGAKPGRRRLRKYILLVALASIVLAATAAWYMTTNSFQVLVHRRLVRELERITGGRVELGSVHTSPFRLRVEIRDLTIHGAEPAGDVPYAHVDRLVAQIKIISLLETSFGFNSIVLDRPIVHIIFYPDGSTNQPQPHVKHANTTPIEQLFSLSINNLQVRHGEVLWADQRVPLDFVVRDVLMNMSYSLLRQRYETNILLGKADTTFNGYRPVAWTAEAHLSLGRNSVDVKSLKATSGRSRVEASGHIKNFRQPQVEGDYDVSLDLAEAAAIARRPDVRRGVLRSAGHGAWSAKDFSSAGQLMLTSFDWRSSPMGLHDASLNAHFTVDPQRVSLSQVQGRLFGGSVTGEAEVSAWQSSLHVQKGGKNSELQKGRANFRLKDLSAAEIAAALSTPARPFHRVNLAAAASGTVDARWKGSPANAEVGIVLDLVPPAHPLAHQLPVSARMRGTYRGAAGELELAELTASTPGTQVRASGTLSSTAALQLAVTTSNLSEWQPVLTAVGYAEPVPITLHGSTSFSGTATGRLTDIAFAGTLQSQEFDVLVPATAQAPARQLHWDSLVTDIHLSPHNFAARNGRLLRDHTAINFDLRTQLEQRHFTDSSSFQARLDTQDADLAGVLALAGYNYPVSGTLNLHARVTGTRADPHGEGHIQLTKAVLYGEPIDSFDADLALNGQEAQLNHISLAQNDARVAGETAFNFSTHGLRFQLTGNNFDLSRFGALQNRTTVEGNLDFTANGAGTLEEPSVRAAIRVRDLTLDHERAGNFSLDATSNGSEVRLTGQSEFEHASLQLDGNVHLRDDWPASISLHFDHLDVDSVLRIYLRGHVTGHSAVAGDLHMEGPLRKPWELQVAGNLDDFFVDVENVKLRNDGPVRFSVSRQALQIEQFHLLGENTDLSLNGRVQLAGERPIDLQAQGRVNLKLIESFDPDFTSSGVVSVDMRVSGVAARPLMQGHVRIENGNIAYSDLPTGLSGIDGSLVFNQDRLQIESLTAHTGGGLITLSGYVTSYNRQINFNLAAQGRDVRLRYPPGVSSTADLDLNFAGTTTASTLSGTVTVNKLGMTPGFDFGAYLARSAQTSALPPTNPMLNGIRLDIHAVTAPDLQMQTAVVRLSGDADLRVRGTAAKPVILGRADIIEGEVYFNGTKYRLERGDVSFANPVSTTPVLDLQAATHIRDYDITLNLNGPIDKPNLTYRSEPPLPTGDIVALLAFGQTTEESAQLQQSNQSAFGQAASSALLNAALNATVSNRVQRLFGVSRIKIDPQGLTTETSPTQTGPAVTIEQQVKNNLTITYTTNVSQASQQIIQAEYNVTRNVSIVGLRDQNGVVSFDVRVRRRKK